MAQPVLVLTRSAGQSRRGALAWRAAGGRGAIVFSPVLRIQPARPFDKLPEGILVFSSENGVAAASLIGPLKGRLGYAVGPRTAAAARAAGMICHEAGGDVEALRRLITADRPGEMLHHLHGAHVTGDLAGALGRDGIAMQAHVVYDQEARPLTAAAKAALEGQAPAVLPLYSPRSARLVAEGLDRAPPQTTVVAISEAVAGAWPYPGPIALAERPDGEAMIACLAGLVARQGER